ncbi:MAG TPA: hypothetical protein PJ982_09015 [Lacipirellulaceae bacterium]|nr:hypothetical protein [Lacipirellulaceae bacterium]
MLGVVVGAALEQRSMACDSPTCTCPAQVTLSCQGAWKIAESPSFQVCSLTSGAEAESVARRCEQVRRDLIDAWGLDESTQPWSPKCQVILHRTSGNYGAAVGGSYAATYGSSLVKPSTGTITLRRIDLRTNVEDYLTAALPHELCHVLMADRFRNGAPPLWYDEGIALLADTEAKQRLHERDLREGMRRKIEFSLAELLVAKEYPPSERMGVFYGQCAALTRYLRHVGSAEQLHRFALRCGEVGVNLGAQECYELAGAQDLENHWRQSLLKQETAVTARILPAGNSDPPHLRLSGSDRP